MQGIRFLISGRVQGVFFRESTATQARRLGVTGHAVNLRDGRVEVIAWGSESALAELAGWLTQGPPMARVDDIRQSPVTEQSAPEEFSTGWK